MSNCHECIVLRAKLTSVCIPVNAASEALIGVHNAERSQWQQRSRERKLHDGGVLSFVLNNETLIITLTETVRTMLSPYNLPELIQKINSTGMLRSFWLARIA